MHLIERRELAATRVAPLQVIAKIERVSRAGFAI